jgi:Fe-S-cluster-containing dehydrogenase component
MCQHFEFKWAQRSQESIWEFRGDMGDGEGRRVMKCEMCTENDREGPLPGVVGKFSLNAVKVVEVQNMARHVRKIAVVLWL